MVPFCTREYLCLGPQMLWFIKFETKHEGLATSDVLL